MIKLPRDIQTDLSKYHAVAHNQSIRIALNYIASNPEQYPQLFFWLFNIEDFMNNQVKFANYLIGSDFEFETPEYTYQTKDGRFIGYNESTKVFTLGIKGNVLGNKIRNNLTHDDILDSPFDINKLIEVLYNGEEENAD